MLWGFLQVHLGGADEIYHVIRQGRILRAIGCLSPTTKKFTSKGAVKGPQNAHVMLDIVIEHRDESVRITM